MPHIIYDSRPANFEFEDVKPKSNPQWVIDLIVHKIPTDTGVGDIIFRLYGHEKSDSFKLWYAETFGVYKSTCNCCNKYESKHGPKLDRWNRMYSL